MPSLFELHIIWILFLQTHPDGYRAHIHTHMYIYIYPITSNVLEMYIRRVSERERVRAGNELLIPNDFLLLLLLRAAKHVKMENHFKFFTKLISTKIYIHFDCMILKAFRFLSLLMHGTQQARESE